MIMKPWMVSLLCLLIALPLVANSSISTPVTADDLRDPSRVEEACGNSTHESFDDEDEETEDDTASENETDEVDCSRRLHRVEHKILGGLNIIGHMVGGSLLMLSATLTFNSNILCKRKRIHRVSGYAFILGGMFIGISAVSMTILFPQRFDPFIIFTNLLWGGVLIIALILALRAALRKKFKIHRAWMIRAYLVAAGPAFHRWFFLLGFGIDSNFGDFLVSSAAVLVGEMIIRKIGLSTLRDMIAIKSKKESTATAK